MKRKTKYILLGAAVLLIVIGTVTAVTLKRVTEKFDSYLEHVEIQSGLVNRTADGIYEAAVNSGVIAVRVRVAVEDQRIIDIALLEHRNGRGEDGEQVIERIIDEQRVDVDTISGATYSSLVIQDAVQQALMKGQAE